MFSRLTAFCAIAALAAQGALAGPVSSATPSVETATVVTSYIHVPTVITSYIRATETVTLVAPTGTASASFSEEPIIISNSATVTASLFTSIALESPTFESSVSLETPTFYSSAPLETPTFYSSVSLESPTLFTSVSIVSPTIVSNSATVTASIVSCVCGPVSSLPTGTASSDFTGVVTSFITSESVVSPIIISDTATVSATFSSGEAQATAMSASLVAGTPVESFSAVASSVHTTSL